MLLHLLLKPRKLRLQRLMLLQFRPQYQHQFQPQPQHQHLLQLLLPLQPQFQQLIPSPPPRPLWRHLKLLLKPTRSIKFSLQPSLLRPHPTSQMVITQLKLQSWTSPTLTISDILAIHPQRRKSQLKSQPRSQLRSQLSQKLQRLRSRL